MITLDIEHYCEKCPDFTPDLFTFFAGNEPYHKVFCRNENRCKQLYQNLKTYLESRGNANTNECSGNAEGDC